MRIKKRKIKKKHPLMPSPCSSWKFRKPCQPLGQATRHRLEGFDSSQSLTGRVKQLKKKDNAFYNLAAQGVCVFLLWSSHWTALYKPGYRGGGHSCSSIMFLIYFLAATGKQQVQRQTCSWTSDAAGEWATMVWFSYRATTAAMLSFKDLFFTFTKIPPSVLMRWAAPARL